LGRVADPLLRFNLNIWAVIVTAVLLIPLATFSAGRARGSQALCH
jgi:hypothetical protein